jgi:hypothetical protein
MELRQAAVTGGKLLAIELIAQVPKGSFCSGVILKE